jgi:hypothetical protein
MLAGASFAEGNVNKVEGPLCKASKSSEVTMTKSEIFLETETLFVVHSTIR